MIKEFITAAIATICFSFIFGAPKKYYPLCGLIGALSWVLYIGLMDLGLSDTESIFITTVIIIILSRLSAVRCRCPVTVFVIAGIIPLVPGAGIYWSAYYLVTNQFALAADKGFLAFKAAIAIVLGIVIVFEFPQKWFTIGIKKR